jgi:hypothetical protein
VAQAQVEGAVAAAGLGGVAGGVAGAVAVVDAAEVRVDAGALGKVVALIETKRIEDSLNDKPDLAESKLTIEYMARYGCAMRPKHIAPIRPLPTGSASTHGPAGCSYHKVSFSCVPRLVA